MYPVIPILHALSVNLALISHAFVYLLAAIACSFVIPMVFCIFHYVRPQRSARMYSFLSRWCLPVPSTLQQWRDLPHLPRLRLRKLDKRPWQLIDITSEVRTERRFRRQHDLNKAICRDIKAPWQVEKFEPLMRSSTDSQPSTRAHTMVVRWGTSWQHIYRYHIRYLGNGGYYEASRREDA